MTTRRRPRRHSPKVPAFDDLSEFDRFLVEYVTDSITLECGLSASAWWRSEAGGTFVSEWIRAYAGSRPHGWWVVLAPPDDTVTTDEMQAAFLHRHDLLTADERALRDAGTLGEGGRIPSSFLFENGAFRRGKGAVKATKDGPKATENGLKAVEVSHLVMERLGP